MLNVNLYLSRYGSSGVASSPKEPELKGYHAVATTGFSLGEAVPPTVDPKSNMLLRSRRIDKLYTHDDQVGPFAKMEFDWDTPDPFLTTSWGEKWTEYDSVNAAPTSVLVPLYHKIRIPFGVIQDMLIPFDNLIEQLRVHNLLNVSERVEWDIYLTTTNDFKDELLRGELPMTPDDRRQLLRQPMPRFMWRATCLDDDSPSLDLLFDATDIEQGSYVVRVNEYDVGLGAVLRGLAQEPELEQQLQDKSCWQIFEWLFGQLGCRQGPVVPSPRWEHERRSVRLCGSVNHSWLPSSLESIFKRRGGRAQRSGARTL